MAAIEIQRVFRGYKGKMKAFNVRLERSQFKLQKAAVKVIERVFQRTLKKRVSF